MTENFKIENVNRENKYGIVFTPDDNFVKYFGVTLQSLIENSSKENFYDVIVFECDITDDNKKRLMKLIPQNFSLRFYNIDTYIKTNFPQINLKSQDYWSIAMFYRIFIPFIMQDYERVLYLDSDMVINNNIDELFSMQTSKKIMAVRDTYSIQEEIYQNQTRLNFIKEILNLDDVENYFNSGMIVFNLINIDLQDYYQKLIDAFNIKLLMYPDQDILNKVFYDEVEYLSFKYNCSIGYKYYMVDMESKIQEKYLSDFLSDQEKPSIIHYTGKLKPWNTRYQKQGVLGDLFWFYARKTFFYEEIILFNSINNMCLTKKPSFAEILFSIKNVYRKEIKHKVITILGIKIKLKLDHKNKK